MARTLNIEGARRFYDRFGKKQDTQAWYEDRATQVLIDHGDFGSARAVVEFGCGTGRFAERLLRGHLPATAHYLGIDVSATMVALSRERLRPWADRVEVRQTDGASRIDAADRSFDRFVSNFVLDLLSEEMIRSVLDEAHRVLADGGRLCLASICPGRTPGQKVVMGLFTGLHRLHPALVGGCRPIDLPSFIAPDRWQVLQRARPAVYGVAMESVVAAPLH